MAVSITQGNYKITSKALNWTLFEKRGKKKKKWQRVGYYITLTALLRDLGEKKLRVLPAKSWTEISRNYQEIKRELEEISRKLTFKAEG